MLIIGKILDSNTSSFSDTIILKWPWQKCLWLETIEVSRARCPIVSNSVMTGWQQNRWLASPLPSSSTKKRFLEDATRSSCQCKQGETCPCQQNQEFVLQFFVAVNNCFAQSCSSRRWFDDGRCPHLSDKSPFPARKIFLSPPSQLFFWICQHRDTTY